MRCDKRALTSLERHAHERAIVIVDARLQKRTWFNSARFVCESVAKL
jgi:hypothetical protein